MKLKSLYEGILADMDDTLFAGDAAADSIWLNQEDSPMRKMFGRGNADEVPFTITTNGQKIITCNTSGVIGIPFNIDGEKNLSDIIDGVDGLVCIGGCTICGDGNTVVTSKTLCDQISADIIALEGIKKLDGINMDIKSMRSYGKFIPTLTVESPIDEISNCHIDVRGNNSKITFKAAPNVPKLTNVSSNTINFIEMPNRAMKAAEWNKLIFNKLFEFGYDLSIFDMKTVSTVKINKMSDILKIVSSKDFYGRCYGECPYRLKRGIKLSDVFDVSKFKTLHRVAVWGSKMGLIFENVKDDCKTADVFGAEVLRQYYSNHPLFNRNNYNEGIPVTADGWRVFIVRV